MIDLIRWRLTHVEIAQVAHVFVDVCHKIKVAAKAHLHLFLVIIERFLADADDVGALVQAEALQLAVAVRILNIDTLIKSSPLRNEPYHGPHASLPGPSLRLHTSNLFRRQHVLQITIIFCYFFARLQIPPPLQLAHGRVSERRRDQVPDHLQVELWGLVGVSKVKVVLINHRLVSRVRHVI